MVANSIFVPLVVLLALLLPSLISRYPVRRILVITLTLAFLRRVLPFELLGLQDSVAPTVIGVFVLIFAFHILRVGVPRVSYHILSEPWILGLLFCLTYLSVSLIWTPTPNYGRVKIINLLAFGVIPAVFGVSLWRRKDTPRVLAWILLFGAMIAVFNLVVVLREGAIGQIRLTYGDINPIWLARQLGAGVMGAVILGLTSRHPRSRLLFWVVGIALIPMMMLTGSRGPLVALMVAIGFLFLMSIKSQTRVFGILVLACLFGIVFLVIGELSSELPGFSRLARFLSLETWSTDSNTLVRITMMREAVEIFAGNPLPGEGVGAFAWWYSGADVRQYPHSIIFELLSEMGLVGLFVSVGMLFYLVNMGYLTIRVRDGRGKLLGLYSLCLFFFVAALFSGDLPGNSELFVAGSTWLATYRFYRRSYVKIFARANPEVASLSLG